MSARSHMEDALGFTLDRALRLQGKTRTDLARALGVAPSTIKRRMDGPGLSVSGAGELDAFVDAVAELLDLEPLALWQDALVVWSGQPRSPEQWDALRRGRNRLASEDVGEPPGR